MSNTSGFGNNNEYDAEDDFGYNPSSAHYVTAMPSGVISFHLKKLKNLDQNHVTEEDPELYLRIRVGQQVKCTKTFVWHTHAQKHFTIVHDIKHFSVMLSRVRVDPSNEVRIDLILIESPNVHRMVGHKDMHVYDIIKNLYLAGTYEMKYRNHSIALLDFEICFAYGIFGYGHSHQLQNRQRKIEDTVSHSFFLRSEPPLNRKQSDNATMAPVPVEPPMFLQFNERALIGSTAVREMLADRYNRFDMDVFHDLEKHEPVILARTIKRRLQKILGDFSELSSRQERKKFLERLILRHEEETPAEEEPIAKDMKGASQAPPVPAEMLDIDHVAAPVAQAYGEDDDHADISDVPELSSFLANAPGIIQTRARGVRKGPMTPVQEDDSDTEQGVAKTQENTPGPSAAATPLPEDTGASSGRRSTVADMGGNFIFSFASKLRMWKSKTPPTQTHEPPTKDKMPSHANQSPTKK